MPGELTATERAVKVEEAFQLRVQGLSFAQIGEQLGVTAKTANLWVREAVKEHQWAADEVAMEHRQAAIDRNQELIKSLYDKAKAGDYASIDRLLKVQDQTLTLVGANAPSKVEATGLFGLAAVSDDQLRVLVGHAVADLKSGGYEVIGEPTEPADES